MHILAPEEIKQAELSLSQKPTKYNHKLKLPSESQLKNIAHFDSTAFPHATPSLKKDVQKMVNFCQNLRSLKSTQPNAAFHMFTFTLINILYQDKYNGSCEGESNQDLLQTIKYSLFLQDMEFTEIKHVGVVVQTSQLKTTINHFLLYMQEQMMTIKANTIRCAEWIIQHNSNLLLAFTLFLRVILLNLGVEKAKDYSACVNVEEAVTNLVEYFDLHHRKIDQIILFYEDGLFLAVADWQIIVGEYYENQREKQNQKEQLEIKSQVKMNMVESVLIDGDKIITPVEVPKKKGIVDSDIMLFNCMLESSSEDQSTRNEILRIRNCQLEAAHSKENGGEFHFRKKKKLNEYKPEDIRNEFQKLIIDEPMEEQCQNQENMPKNSALGNQQQLKIAQKNDKKKMAEPHIMETQIEQPKKIDILKIVSEKESPKNYVSLSAFRKTDEKVKYSSIFKSPSTIQLAANSHSSDTHCTSTKDQSANAWKEIINCACRKTRIKRNSISSKVVEVALIAEKKDKHSNNLWSVTEPKFMKNFKLNEQKDKDSSPLAKNRSKQQQKVVPSRRPAFLSNLKKRKQQLLKRQDCSKSIPNQQLKFEQSLAKVTSHRRLRHTKFKSCVEDLDYPLEHESRSTHKLHQNKSVKTISIIENFQKSNERVNNMQGVHPNKKQWQTVSNFIQQVPQYKHINNIKTSQMSNTNTRQASTSPLKFYAPVQIVAPTVYVNSNSKNPNNLMIQLHDENGKLQLQVNPQLKLNNGGESSSLTNPKGGMICPLNNGKSGFCISSRETEQRKRFI